MGIRKGTPAAREDRLSFFKEISQKQLASYQPDQIAIILRQRENVRENGRSKSGKCFVLLLNHHTGPTCYPARQGSKEQCRDPQPPRSALRIR